MNLAGPAAVLLALLASPGSVQAGEDPRELEGRALFARGEYQSALDLYSKLFAERGDAIYLRNVGRCYQLLGRPERAIGAFREYLRRTPTVSAQERVEIEGFIREMEILRAQQPAPPASPRPRMIRDLFADLPPPPPVVKAPAIPDQSVPARPIVGRWWFWAAIGTAVMAGTVTAIVLTSRD